MTVCVVERRDPAVIPTRDDDTATRVPVDQLIAYLAETAKDRKDHPLSPLRSYDWFSTENYRRVRTWCLAALTIVEAESACGQSVVFLADAMVDRYHYDRALRAASALPNHPTPRREAETFRAKNGDPIGSWESFVWSEDTRLEITDLVGTITGPVIPDSFYQLRVSFKHHIYAKYGKWFIKVVEWK